MIDNVFYKYSNNGDHFYAADDDTEFIVLRKTKNGLLIKNLETNEIFFEKMRQWTLCIRE